MKKRLFVFLTAMCLTAVCLAQQPSPSSITCNADGTVTFRYKNDQAKQVQVDVQFAGRQPMTRDGSGVWTATLGPAAPDMYPYCFVVDGISVMDPENPQYFPNEGFKNSLLEIPARDGSLPHDIRDVPHGRLEYIHYYSKSLGATNQAVVYLPPNYMMDYQKKYPVFYLISGTTDTEEVYYKVGRVNYILDNLLADKQAKEMIVVLPYGNPTKLKPKPAGDGAPQTRFGNDPFSLDLINDLMPYIEQNYRTVNNREHRAIGGFSRGGNQALYNGLSNLDKFSYLCSYSSFTSTDIPDVYDNADDTNKKIRLFWLGVGTDDFLYGNARDYMEFLDKKGIRSVKELTTGKYGHTWMNAKYFLSKTLPLLFNKKASETAMKEGQPAPAATGQEQQFTPGVMARLFPKPVVSPEYGEESITFRMKAPEAQHVELWCEILPDLLPMEKDADGIWSVTMNDFALETFKYCFVVDGTRVADPSNMLLSPDRGFKYSLADSPLAPFSYAQQGDIKHGRTSYDVERQEAWYMAPMSGQPSMPVFIQLVPGANDTMESWFKVGGADAIADKMIADGLTKSCVITTSSMDFMGQGGGMPMMGNFQPRVLRADDYPTWPQRRRALLKLLMKIGKEPAPEFPSFGGGGGMFMPGE
jgi:enterochelin esterase-like enzyme